MQISSAEFSGCDAFNGQAGRVALFCELQTARKFSATVETGTYLGATAELFAVAEIPQIKTIEAQAKWAQHAAVRLSSWPNVEVICADSREILRQLAKEDTFPRANALFYLDAHWYADLPLVEELQLVLRHWRNSIIIIDDFHVPFDSGYGFDDYGPGKSLCRSLIHDYLPQNSPTFFPALPSDQETGSRRGCVVVGTDEEASRYLATVSLLKKFP